MESRHKSGATKRKQKKEKEEKEKKGQKSLLNLGFVPTSHRNVTEDVRNELYDVQVGDVENGK